MQVGANPLVAALVTERHDLLPESPRIGAALVPAVVQVGLVVVEDRGAVLPLAGEQFLRLRGVGVPFDGVPAHPELPLDRSQAVSCFQQGMNGCVPGPSPVGKAVTCRPWRRGRVRGVNVPWFGLRRCGRQDAQAATVLGDTPLGGLAQVVPQMPSIRDLHSLWCSDSGTFSEERRAVPAYDLDTGPLCEPGGQAGCLPVREQIDRTAGLNVHQHGAVVAALSGGVLVDADHPRCGHLRLRQSVDQAQYRAPADGHAEDGSQPGAARPARARPSAARVERSRSVR